MLRLLRQFVFDVRSAAMARCSAASEMGTSMLRAGLQAVSYAGEHPRGGGTSCLRSVSGVLLVVCTAASIKNVCQTPPQRLAAHARA